VQLSAESLQSELAAWVKMLVLSVGVEKFFFQILIIPVMQLHEVYDFTAGFIEKTRKV